jgi:hypothetical protein
MIRDAFQRVASAIFDKFRDDDTGKIKVLSPKALKTLVLTMIFTISFIILVIKLWTPKESIVGGSETFKKEMQIDNGIKTASYTENGKVVGGSNPLEFGGGSRDPLDKLIDLQKNPTEEKTQNKNEAGVASADLTVTDCLNLNDKIKTGSKLEENEKLNAKVCLEKNIAGLSASDKVAYEKLLSGTISDGEKKLLMKKLNGDLEGGSPEEKIADALMDSDPRVKGADQAYADRDKKALETFVKSINGDQLTPQEKELLKKYQDQSTKQVTSAVDQAKKESAKDLANEIAKNEKIKQDLELKLKEAQVNAKEAAKKIQEGNATKMSEKEQKALQQIAELNKKYEDIKKQQDQRVDQYNKAKKLAQDSWQQSDMVVKQSIPSGIGAEYITLAGKKKIKAKKKNIKIMDKTEEKISYVDIDGQPLKADKIKLVQLFRQKKYQLDRIKRDIKNPLGNNVTKEEENFNNTVNNNPSNDLIASNDNGRGNIDSTSLMDRERIVPSAQGGEGYKIDQSVVWSNKEIKTFNFTPDMKIPAVLDSEILISSKSKGQVARIKIVADIHDPATNKLIIPKGSIAIATVSGSSFDVDTGLMDFTVTKISTGSGKTIDVSMNVGSGDGSMGLKGKVHDTRGKYLIGAFITSFTGGALQWFGQQIVQPYQTSTAASSAITGAALGGGAEVMQKIAEMYAGDLQNAAKIYWCPKKVPIILFPN